MSITVARTLNEAISAPGEIRAGSTDLQERRQRGLAFGPLVDISRLQGYDAITWDERGAASIGTLVTIGTVAGSADMAGYYPGLALAAGSLATPQIRRMATLGGSLLQRTRCWYYRHPAFTCYKKGGQSCPARDGHHHHGVCFDLGPCVFPHPSTVGMALLAYEAEVEINGQTRQSVAALFGDGSDPSRDHTLEPGQILTSINLPPPVPGEQAAYFRAIGRAAAEWPLVEAVARLVVTDGRIELARVAVGGVANIPLRLLQVEAALSNQVPTPELLAAAAALAQTGAAPLPQTGYKVDLLVGTVLEVLERSLNTAAPNDQADRSAEISETNR